MPGMIPLPVLIGAQREVFLATFGAYFAQLMHAHMMSNMVNATLEPLDEYTYAYYVKESSRVAELAARRVWP